MIIRILKKAMDMVCPKATQDVALNTKNRNATRENHMYGPLNVEEPGDYWEKLAKKWDTSEKAAKKVRAAFVWRSTSPPHGKMHAWVCFGRERASWLLLDASF